MSILNLLKTLARLAILAAMVFLVASAAFLSGGIHQDAPAFEDSGKEEASRFNATAKTALAPAYQFLAGYIVDRFEIRGKQGIGIDIGGGPGDLVLELSKRTPGFYWIDADINPWFSGFLYQEALKNHLSHRIGFVFADAHYLPFRDNYADLIVSRGSMQQWNNREQAFAEMYRVLKPGGHAFIGRGFSENMPLEVAKKVREMQGGGPGYSPDSAALELEEIMRKLQISDYEILRPRMDQEQVNYGVWIIFTKPG